MCDRSGYDFFQNRGCEFFPCHADAADINCLFCFCPLYCLGERCGGDFAYTAGGAKDCSACVKPHAADGYAFVMSRIYEVMGMAANTNST
ncbi:MAG: cysteine-rich small domain-containing protein [Clostridiales bacterium]|jgi:Zn-finger protein|nr:cysteine-rich small domain-containing protein [Clostridiales bacterium]